MSKPGEQEIEVDSPMQMFEAPAKKFCNYRKMHDSELMCGKCGSPGSTGLKALSEPQDVPIGGGRVLTMRLCWDCKSKLEKLKGLE